MTTPSAGRPRKHILIVEDDADSRRALTNALEDEGYTIAARENGSEALEYLRESPRPHLIVLDLVMPGMDGWEFRHLQSQDARLASIPVIGVSAVGKLVDVDVSLRKPVDYDELLAAVARYVGRAPRPTARLPRGKRRRQQVEEALR